MTRRHWIALAVIVVGGTALWGILFAVLGGTPGEPEATSATPTQPAYYVPSTPQHVPTATLRPTPTATPEPYDKTRPIPNWVQQKPEYRNIAAQVGIDEMVFGDARLDDPTQSCVATFTEMRTTYLRYERVNIQDTVNWENAFSVYLLRHVSGDLDQKTERDDFLLHCDFQNVGVGLNPIYHALYDRVGQIWELERP